MVLDVLLFLKKLCNRIQVIVTSLALSFLISMGFLNILKTVVKTPKTFSTITRVLDNRMLKVRCNEPMTWFPGKGFITCLLNANAPPPRKTYGILHCPPGSGLSGGKLIVPVEIFPKVHYFEILLRRLFCPEPQYRQI